MDINNKNIMFVVILVLLFLVFGLLFISLNNSNNIEFDLSQLNNLEGEENLDVEVVLSCGDGICDLGEKVNNNCLEDCLS